MRLCRHVVDIRHDPDMSTKNIYICRHLFFYFKFKKNNASLLGCSGPLDNARTIPECLKNNLKNVEKVNCFY